MAYGLRFRPLDISMDVDISTGWQPARYVGSFKCRAPRYLEREGSLMHTETYDDIPDGSVLWVHPNTHPSANVKTDRDSFGSWTSSYDERIVIKGKTVEIRAGLIAGYARSFWANLRITYDVYAFYPPTTHSSWGLLLQDSGIPTAVDNNTRPHVCRFRRTIRGTTSDNISVDTGIPTTDTPPIIFVSDTGGNNIAGFIYRDGGANWKYRLRRTYQVRGGGIGYYPIASGDVRIAGFVPYDGTIGSYGLNLYSENGSIMWSSAYAPLMPRRLLTNSRPRIYGHSFAREDDAGDTFTTEEMANHPMIIPRMLGMGKVWNDAASVSTAVIGNRYTWGWSYSGYFYLPGNSSGYWGMTDQNAAPNPMIYGTDYFNDY